MRTDSGCHEQVTPIGTDGLDHRPRRTHVTVAELYERSYTRYATRMAVRSRRGR